MVVDLVAVQQRFTLLKLVIEMTLIAQWAKSPKNSLSSALKL